MAPIEDATETERRSPHRWLLALVAFGTPGAFLFSLTVVLVAAMNDQVLVSSRLDLKSVDLGWPLVWIHQDQSSSDPPFPTHRGVLSPWENPTRLSLDSFLVNALVVFAAVAVGVVLTAALVVTLVRLRRARTGATARSAT